MFKSTSQISRKGFINLLLFLTFLSFNGIAHSQDYVDYQLVNIDCINTIGLQKNQFVINSPAEYQKIRQIRMDGRKFGIDCKTLPRIDFNMYTLIGYIVHSGGCEQPTYNLEFTSEDDEYTLICYVSAEGVCRRMWTEFFWVVTKKITPNEAIKFKQIYM
jgi:hypothetical protein